MSTYHQTSMTTSCPLKEAQYSVLVTMTNSRESNHSEHKICGLFLTCLKTATGSRRIQCLRNPRLFSRSNPCLVKETMTTGRTNHFLGLVIMIIGKATDVVLETMMTGEKTNLYQSVQATMTCKTINLWLVLVTTTQSGETLRNQKWWDLAITTTGGILTNAKKLGRSSSQTEISKSTSKLWIPKNSWITWRHKSQNWNPSTRNWKTEYDVKMEKF